MIVSIFLLPFLPLILAIPTSIPKRQSTSCSAATTTLEPRIIQFVKESAPSTSFPNEYHEGGQVTISQNVESTEGGFVPTDRVYTIIAFPDVPDTAYECQLEVFFPPNYLITTLPTGSAIPPVDIHTFGVNQLGDSWSDGNAWNWVRASFGGYSRSYPWVAKNGELIL